MSEIKVNKLSPRSGTTVTIGDSGDTINIVGTLQNNGSAIPGDISSVVAGTGLSGGGTSGDVTLNIEAAQPTITSLGTITSFRSIGIDDNADATAITINSSESVGINNTNMASFDADARNLVVGSGSGDNGLTVYSDGSSSGSIFFANGTSGAQTKQGQIVYEQNNNAMIFSTAATERFRVTSDGLCIGGTGAANALDDYEKGTYTAGVFDANSGGNQSATTATGYYTKIGRLVNFNVAFANINTTGLTGSNRIFVSLPFASINGQIDAQTSPFVKNVTFNDYLIFGESSGSQKSRFGFISIDSGSNSSSTTVSNFTDDDNYCSISLTYITDD